MSSLAEKIVGSEDPLEVLNTIYRAVLHERDDRAGVAAELVPLHNARTVNLVDVFLQLKNKPGAGHDFFLTRHVIEQALPDLDAPVEPVMRCVQHLYQEAGRDMAAGQILGSFRTYCERMPERIGEALGIVEANPPDLLALLPSILAAGAEVDACRYQAQTARLTAHDRLDVRQTAVFAMGVIRCADPGEALKALEVSLQQSEDDHLLGNVVRSTYRLLQLDRGLQERAMKLMDRALQKGGEQALHAAADLYWLESKELKEHEPVLEVLRRHLPRVPPKNTGTIKSIDRGLAQHMKQSPERSFALLESLLPALGGNSFAEHFDSVAHLLEADQALLSKMMTRWFMRGHSALCKAIHHVVVTQSHGKKLELSVDSAEVIPNDTVHVTFLARKAVGYLLMHPVAAASVVVSIMRIAPEEALPELAGLLFDPVLLNFPGVTEDYLAAQAETSSGKVQASIKAAIAELEKYLKRLRAIGSISELHPSNEQREAHRRHFSRLVSESFKQAQAQSVFMQIASRAVLLYGRKSISHVYGSDGTPHRTEIPLSPHGVTIDIPRVEQLDPLGMDYRLRVFRQEQFRK